MPATALVAAVAAALSVASPSWALPVDGAVAGRFRFDAARPYAAGWRRGVDLRAGAGSPVRAACSGRVSHAGAVPRWAIGVSVRCGRFVATHLGLGGLVVRRGERVRREERIGWLGPAGVLRLGARLRRKRFGWVDPLALIARPRPRGAPLGPPPPSGPRGARRPAPRPQLVRSPPPRPAGPGVPAVAWVAAAGIAAGLPAGPLLAARRWRRQRRAAARTGGVAAGEGRGPPIF